MLFVVKVNRWNWLWWFLIEEEEEEEEEEKEDEVEAKEKSTRSISFCVWCDTVRVCRRKGDRKWRRRRKEENFGFPPNTRYRYGRYCERFQSTKWKYNTICAWNAKDYLYEISLALISLIEKIDHGLINHDVVFLFKDGRPGCSILRLFRQSIQRVFDILASDGI